jgi:YVTN family beta-propeller protein
MGVVVEPEGRKVYVANSLSNDVSVVSAQSGALLTTVSVEPKPQRLTVTRDGSEVLVASYESSRLSAISVNTNQVSRTLTADRWLSDITLDSRLNRYYLVQDRTNRLLFYEPRSQLSIKTVVVGNNPFRVAVGPDLRTLFVVCRKDNTVVLINRISGELETVLEVGKLPYDVKVVELP